MKYFFSLLLLLSVCGVAHANATITLHNDSGVLLNVGVYGMVAGNFGSIIGAEIKPGEFRDSIAAHPPGAYDIFWAERGCSYRRHLEDGCILEWGRFAIYPQDRALELRPSGEVIRE